MRWPAERDPAVMRLCWNRVTMIFYLPPSRKKDKAGLAGPTPVEPKLDRTGRSVNLRQMFLRVQREMLACLSSGVLLNHSVSTGATTERRWIELLNRYLPERYRASSAFIVDASGRRSRQIDIAIYDRFYSPLLFPDECGPHIPAESVYAVFEVKQVLDSNVVLDAALKAASVRGLSRTSAPIPSAAGMLKPRRPQPILAGVLTQRTVWGSSVKEHLARAMKKLAPTGQLDLGCAVDQIAFEVTPPAGSAGARGSLADRIDLSNSGESLIFFMIRLLDRLRALGTAPALDYSAYFRRPGK